MRRKLFHIAAATSALIAIAVLVLAARTIWFSDSLEWSGWDFPHGNWRMMAIGSRGGDPTFVRVVNTGILVPSPGHDVVGWTYRRFARPMASHPFWPVFLIHSGTTPGPKPMKWENWDISVPDWMLVAAGSVLPMIW